MLKGIQKPHSLPLASAALSGVFIVIFSSFRTEIRGWRLEVRSF
jgi:hypothetical protein